MDYGLLCGSSHTDDWAKRHIKFILSRQECSECFTTPMSTKRTQSVLDFFFQQAILLPYPGGTMRKKTGRIFKKGGLVKHQLSPLIGVITDDSGFEGLWDYLVMWSNGQHRWMMWQDLEVLDESR